MGGIAAFGIDNLEEKVSWPKKDEDCFASSVGSDYCYALILGEGVVEDAFWTSRRRMKVFVLMAHYDYPGWEHLFSSLWKHVLYLESGSSSY